MKTTTAQMCHMILQKSFKYADLLLYLSLLSMLKTSVLLNIFVETMIFLMNRK